ncbi:MAG: DNA polymerase III subunit delta' [Peptoniphilaceae bacterium]|nr:DNA polymerase III subunit delta' [Peptoniphilaceae bacterium]MDY6019122.1 DNA polymerase III subunit delta' [Anaerococcus sp.]
MEILKSQLENNRLTSAYIFESQNPTYNLEKAIEFANLIFKKNGIIVENNQNPDLIVINKEDDYIRLDDVREVIKSMYLRPLNGRVKVYIFNNSQNLRKESSNALLKSIEEPSSYSFIIFTTTNAYSLLPTIRSRCQIIKINKEKEQSNINQDKLTEILVNLLDGKLDSYYKNKSFFDACKDEREDLFDSIVLFFRNILLCKYDDSYKLNQSKDIKKLDKLSFDLLEDLINKTEKIKKAFKFNTNYDLSVEKLIFYIYRKAR